MKQIWILILSLLIVASLFANGVIASPRATLSRNSRYEVVAYSENFETGGTGWTHFDGSSPDYNWHIYNDGGTQGNVWWMGDPTLANSGNIGGYLDHQYLVLDTPQIQVPTASPTLTFKMKYKVEALGTSGDYNGWDAINIRISNNNGLNWTVISGTPAYNMTSSYAFGEEHDEGVGIAGWGGNSNGWVNASFNLSSYAGQTVKIRFAFASDPNLSTSDDPTLFGVMVDDIVLGTFTNNGVDDGQLTWDSLVPVGGDLWHVDTVNDAPSPTHAMICQNATNTYNTNMLNYLISPPITLPETGDLRADFMFKANITDPDPHPRNDHFGWQISINNGFTWYEMSDPYNTPTNDDNFVYPPPTENPTSWYSMTEFFSLDGYISDYAGQTVMFRWFLKSDADAPQGVGFMIDDFKIYQDIFLAEPANLTAAVTGNSVNLNWTTPGGGGEPGWLTYSSEFSEGSIGLTDGGSMEVAAKWAPAGTNSILPYVGMNITQVQFWPAEAGITYTIRIYTGAAGNTVYSQVVTAPVADAWNTVTLTTPFTIPSGTYVWVGYLSPHAAGQYPAGHDDGPAIAGFGNMLRASGSWSQMTVSDANWNIKAYVTDGTGRTILMSQDNSMRDRDITSFKVYRDDAFISEVLPTVLTYNDINVPDGLHQYKVTAMYGANESFPSNAAQAYILPSNYVELGFDDGSSDLGFNAGASNIMAVKYQHTEAVIPKYVKVYVSEVRTNPMFIRIYDDTGENGLPGSQHLTQFTYPATSIIEGWNYILIPQASILTIEDGSFYLAITESVSSSSIGFDTSSNGHSYKKTSAGWAPLTNGEIMLHCIAETGVDNEDPIIIPVTLTSGNYPNPFNPETTIKYSVPQDGHTTITIYNTKGQVIRSLLNTKAKAGSYNVSWNGYDENGNAVASGVYIYKLSNNNNTITKKMLLSR